jgi:hypothetical protein
MHAGAANAFLKDYAGVLYYHRVNKLVPYDIPCAQEQVIMALMYKERADFVQ